jgi:hypothetical protein
MLVNKHFLEVDIVKRHTGRTPEAHLQQHKR